MENELYNAYRKLKSYLAKTLLEEKLRCRLRNEKSCKLKYTPANFKMSDERTNDSN
jgi:hypothetical protein